MTRIMSSRWFGAVVTAAALCGAAVAQPPRPAAPPGPLDLATAKRQIAEQKAEREIADVLKAADQQARFNPAKAAQILKTAKADLQFASVGEAVRTNLTNLLDAKLAAVEGRPFAAPAPNPGVILDPKGAETKAGQKLAAERYIAEVKAVREGIDRVKELEAKGQSAAADAEIAKLARTYGHNPAVSILTQQDSIAGRVADAQAFAKLQNDRMFAVQKGLMEASLPAVRDIEFPADWAEKSRRRLQTVQLTAKEKKIIEALDKPITVNFRERPFEEALQDLSNMLDLPLLLDKKSVEDLGLDLKRGATLEARGLSARTVLRSVLASQGLTFVVKDETIQVVTVERARSQLTTRVYYLGDLVQGGGPFGDIRWGPFLNMQQTAENVQVLIATIEKSIDPLSWRAADGPGTVTFHYPSMSIIVRASSEVHYTLGRTFNGK